MIGDYLVVVLVFGIAASFVAIIHHFWLRDAFKDDAPLDVPAQRNVICEIPTPKAFSASEISRAVTNAGARPVLVKQPLSLHSERHGFSTENRKKAERKTHK